MLTSCSGIGGGNGGPPPPHATFSYGQVGTTLSVKGGQPTATLKVTLLKVSDPAVDPKHSIAASPQNRFVAYEFKIENMGSSSYTPGPGDVALFDATGQHFGIDRGAPIFPPLQAMSAIAPGASGTGWAIYEVPTSIKPVTLLYAVVSAGCERADKAAEWAVGPAGSPTVKQPLYCGH